ncbi:MAG: glutamate synthase [Lentisphaerae bacterium GWF2_49_21]|nr:MAG: glutamate synthase [Lentisphaerae bacterium GWF2_49_21]
MGKPRGFIEIPRKEPGYRPEEERILDYNEVEKRLKDEELREQAARCMDCGIPFCHGCGCPLGNLIPEWNDLVYHGHWKEALELLYSTNNFPEFTGRICPALCEAACTVGLNSEPVLIRQIEISLIEKGYNEGYIKPYIPEKRSDKKIAVVGSGPAGLAVADQLNHMGHSVTVYEQYQKIGGILRYGIPDFKLDKKIIRRRIDLMSEEGVVFETGVTIGRDISANYLLSRFDAVCLTCGAREPRDLKVPGRELDGVHMAMDFLTQQNKRIGRESYSCKEITAKGKKVVVIGGGDTGSDCVGTSIRQGALSVVQIEIMPKPPETRSKSTPWPEWPYVIRASSSHKEGCERMWNIMTKSFEGEGNKLKRLNCIKVEWETDLMGRPKAFKEIPKSEFYIPADLSLIAMGFSGVEKKGMISDIGIKLAKNGTIAVDENGMTNIKGVFAAGDSVAGASLVVRAIAAGRELAMKIGKYLEK